MRSHIDDDGNEHYSPDLIPPDGQDETDKRTERGNDPQRDDEPKPEA